MEIVKIESLDNYGLVKEEKDGELKFRVKGSPGVYLCVDTTASRGEILIESSSYSLITMAQKAFNRLNLALDKLNIVVKKMIEDGVIVEE